MNNQGTVNINGTDRVIKKLPLGKYSEVLVALQELPKVLEDIDGFKNEEVIQRLPKMIATALPELAKVLSIATDIPEKEIVEEFGLDDLTEVVAVVLEVNNIEKVVENIKKIMARKVFQTQKQVPAEPPKTD